jgi:hypothetical protein
MIRDNEVYVCTLTIQGWPHSVLPWASTGVTAGPKLLKVTVAFCICCLQMHLNSTGDPIANHLAGLPLHYTSTLDADILHDLRNKPSLGWDNQGLPSWDTLINWRTRPCVECGNLICPKCDGLTFVSMLVESWSTISVASWHTISAASWPSRMQRPYSISSWSSPNLVCLNELTFIVSSSRFCSLQILGRLTAVTGSSSAFLFQGGISGACSLSVSG